MVNLNPEDQSIPAPSTDHLPTGTPATLWNAEIDARAHLTYVGSLVYRLSRFISLVIDHPSPSRPKTIPNDDERRGKSLSRG